MNQDKISSVIILGAGLTGLTTAFLLRKSGVEAIILEARDRPGGRIHTLYKEGEASLEMGATWLGKKHIHLTSLLKELQLEIYPQHLDPFAIYDPAGQSPVQLFQLAPNPDPSQRIQGGSTALIQKLAYQLTENQLFLNCPVHSIHLEENVFRLRTNQGDFPAERVISTLPPHLLVSSVQISPELPSEIILLARNTHTWMGESIKVGLTYPRAFWRSADKSGTIFSQEGPIIEMYDHSSPEQDVFALKGFLKESFYDFSREERKNLVIRQLKKIYGQEAANFLSYEETLWIDEKYTYADYPEEVLPHQNNGNSLFRKAFLNGRFWIAGSETSQSFPGYMDGAVQSAQWTSEAILRSLT